MSTRFSPRVALVVLSAALASACGTGLHARTYLEHGRQDGAAADVGGMTGVGVRDLHVLPPQSGIVLAPGSTAVATGGLVNDDNTPDALVGASTDAATSVTLTLDGTPTSSIAVPAQSAADPTWGLVLNNLTRPLPVATYIQITLQFQHAGRITLQVPIEAGTSDLDTRPTQQNPYGEK